MVVTRCGIVDMIEMAVIRSLATVIIESATRSLGSFFDALDRVGWCVAFVIGSRVFARVGRPPSRHSRGRGFRFCRGRVSRASRWRGRRGVWPKSRGVAERLGGPSRMVALVAARSIMMVSHLSHLSGEESTCIYDGNDCEVRMIFESSPPVNGAPCATVVN